MENKWEITPEKLCKEKIKKRGKTVTVIIFTLLIILLITVAFVYWRSHPTHYKFEDGWVMGNNKEEIVKRYGLFDKLNYKTKNGKETDIIYSAGYLVKKGDFYSSLPTPEQYYLIYFDEQGVAIDITIRDYWD